MSNKIFQVIAVLAILLAVIAVSRPAGDVSRERPNALDNIRLTGRIDVCDINYPPWNIIDPASGEVSGVYAEAIELIAGKMGVTPNYKSTTWGNIVADLVTGRCDVNIAAIFPLIERAYGGAIFTKPLGIIGNNGLVKKGDTRFSVIEDLNREDIIIAVTEGEQGHIYAQKYLPKAQLHVTSSADISLAFTEVSVGRADVSLGDSWTINQYLEANPDTDLEVLLDEPYTVSAFTWAVHEDEHEWLNFLNNALGVLERNGELDRLMEKYGTKIQRPE